ncbi:hypothetical protein OS965_22740 [Streptomyces sp. H27-G5]|uniref:hypothetical protein n=1 Tax=Streptomyces sp. H27-G5 TaxID=2996698 RepID=UPI00227012B3|nr:hypothetical protein [Streptomyces sp. H27-G5]MCY0920965.1 hypothetical protein [Streptomyces sp. H27-G5]
MSDARTRLATVAAEWDELRPRLEPAALHTLSLLLAGLREATGEAADRAARHAARLLGEQLPDRFPDDGRLTAAPTSSRPDLGHLGFSADDLVVLVLDGHRMVGPVLGEVRERLLAAPSLGEAEAAERGCDPNAPGLIRLRGPGGPVRLPAFQFARDGRVVEVVPEVNLLLEADRDPWGAADWWLSPNAWLAEVPARLLGTVAELQVLTAARFLREGE